MHIRREVDLPCNKLRMLHEQYAWADDKPAVLSEATLSGTCKGTAVYVPYTMQDQVKQHVLDALQASASRPVT